MMKQMNYVYRHFSLNCVFDFKKYRYVLIEQSRTEKLKIKQIFEKDKDRHGFFIDDSSVYILFETNAEDCDALMKEFEDIASCHLVQASDIPDAPVWF